VQVAVTSIQGDLVPAGHGLACTTQPCTRAWLICSNACATRVQACGFGSMGKLAESQC
jgi:hypothetical protein